MSSRLGSGQDRRLGLREGGEICALARPFVFPPFALAGAEPARQLTVFTPSGIEDLFDALMPVLAGGGEETPEAVTALNAAHDTIVPPTDRLPYRPLD